MKNVIILCLMSVILIACGGLTNSQDPAGEDGGDRNTQRPTIRGQVMSGEVGGRTWTFISGRVKKSNFMKGLYSFSFWNENVRNNCDSLTFGSDEQVIGLLPLSIGEFSLGNYQNLTFVANGTNKVSTDGKVIIESIENDVVKGSLISIYDGDNYIEGAFEIPLCDLSTN